MSPKMGRPFKVDGEPRNVQMRLRLTANEKKLIEELAEALGTTQTEAVLTACRKMLNDLKAE